MKFILIAFLTLMPQSNILNMKSVIYWSSQGWNAIQKPTLQKSWVKILGANDHCEEIQDDVDLHNMMLQIPACATLKKNNTEEWANGDDSEYKLTDDDTGQLVNSEEAIVNDSEDGENVESQRITHEEGLNALELALKYVEEQAEANASDLLLMKRWRDIAANKRLSKLKQSCITDFMKQ